MPTTYGTASTIPLPSDTETIDGSDVNTPFAAIWDQHDVLADTAALTAILVPTHGLIRYVRGLGHYEDAAGSGYVPTTIVFDASSSIKIGADATKGVARDGDDICLGYFLWDVSITTVYRSPPELGPLLTVYSVWAVYPAGTTFPSTTFAPLPGTPGVPPTPGTPGSAWNGLISEASSLVKCE